MKILGVDYGRSKIGLAVSEGKLAEPLRVIKVKSFDDATEKVLHVIQALQVEKVVVGVSEGEMGEESKKFASLISNRNSEISVDFFDETLSSIDAQTMSREAGIHRKKRKDMEDAYAATIMLQNFLASVN
jgi:putative Holliday junction resolvase